MIIQSKIEKYGKIEIPNPEYGDMKLNVYPFINSSEWVKLPEQFQKWEKSLNSILEFIPLIEGCNQHYITIDSKFFTTDEFLRREGIHIDGNFCADPDFKYCSWGGGGGSWMGLTVDRNGKPQTDFAIPYDIEIPIGTYVSGEKGGIFSVSNEIGCQAWEGEFIGEILDGGDFSEMTDQLKEPIIFGENELVFMTSNTPHETLMIDKGKRRTFMRLSLNHNYPNEVLKRDLILNDEKS